MSYAGEYDQYLSSKPERTEAAFEVDGVEYESGIPAWFDLPEVWDVCTIGGVRVPGICRLSGDVTLNLDVKNPPGGDPTISNNGKDPARFEITAVLWTRKHWAEMQLFVSKFNPLSESGGKPVDINHVILAMYGIRSVIVEAISFPVVTNGQAEIRIKLTQWYPPPAKPKKNKAKTPTSSEANPPDAHPETALGLSDIASKSMEEQQEEDKQAVIDKMSGME